MSGGSYRYLCYADTRELMGYKSELIDMSQRLAGLGYAADAADETDEILDLVRSDIPNAPQMIEPLRRRLADVWQAVEWWDSGDGSESMVQRALNGYRS